MKPIAFKDHFSARSADYARYRPEYPPALVDALADACARHERALDCGCGTGQLSVPLAARFAEVVAIDASREQIDRAHAHPAVRYRVAAAEDSGLPAASVDLVTVAQAAHWLDPPRFHAEVRRVARPGALLAWITYGIPRLDDARLDARVRAFHDRDLGPWWPPERRHVVDGYRDLPFPHPAVELPPLALSARWHLDELLGYLGTWSAVTARARELGDTPFANFRAKLAADWGEPKRCREITWPLTVRAGRIGLEIRKPWLEA